MKSPAFEEVVYISLRHLSTGYISGILTGRNDLGVEIPDPIWRFFSLLNPRTFGSIPLNCCDEITRTGNFWGFSPGV
jgi:hypothetical protein